MKANEAPEKIYLNWVNYPLEEMQVEYTRTDAFIKKACVKLKKLMYDNLMFQGRWHREEIIETFVGEFRKFYETD